MATLSLKKCLSAAVLVTVSSWGYAGTTVITFDEDTIAGNVVALQHGTVINSQYAALGVNVSVNNKSSGNHYGVLYNTAPGTASPDKNNNRDSDLTGPSWGNSNFNSRNFNAGNALVIQENGTGCGDGVCDQPDDQAGRRSDGLAGYVTFNLDFTIDALGFDLIDFQTNVGAGEVEKSEVMLFDNALKVQSFKFSDFVNRPNGAMFGENSINRIFLDSFASTNVNKVKFKIFGSGAVDNLRLTSTDTGSTTTVPEPGTLALFGLTLLGMLRLNRIK
ncbi:PEP-CTERM sorting domain-containing protein [Aliiglaciecola litoralis]|uniref:Ice-binding protein C-terminal domain-containing protein n=1 Tax=Aliiglaciecola litoralis TaxID=582857 RepID=A0ABP3X0T6_9ALTE